MNDEVPDWLQRYQREHGWTMRQMALKFGIPTSTTHSVMSRRARADPDTLKKIAAHTHVPLDELLVMGGYRTENVAIGDPLMDEVIALSTRCCNLSTFRPFVYTSGRCVDDVDMSALVAMCRPFRCS